MHFHTLSSGIRAFPEKADSSEMLYLFVLSQFPNGQARAIVLELL